MVDRTLESPPKPPVPVTDGELLMRYARHGEEAALVEVIERHRGMIWGVCSRVLARRADAEDAYQATLLILARKAGSVRANDSAAGWLFRVAHNAAIAARRRHKRRRESSLEESPPAAEEAFPDLARQEVVAALLEELRSLPAKYQTPLALRYLEGRSRREIAAALDATVATVAGQLVRGRRMLRSRLARRGVSLGLALGAFGTAGTAHAASVVYAQPPAVNLSALLTGSSSAASAGVHGLVTHGMRSMFYASVTKPAAAGLAAVVAAMVLLVEPPEGAAQANNGAPQLDATVIAASEEGTAGGPVQIATREAPGQAEPGTQDPGAPPAESAPATPSLQQDFVATLMPEGVNATFVPGSLSPEEQQKSFDNLKKHYAKQVAAMDQDLSQASFEEYYWQVAHWRGKQDALRFRLNLLNQQQTELAKVAKAGEVPRAELLRLANERMGQMQTASAELSLARANVLKYERLLKQAALRETQQPPRGQQGAHWPVPGVISPPSDPYRASPEPVSGGLPRLKPGDVVLIDSTLPENERSRYQGPRTIEADGSLPAGALIGRLKIGGLTLREAEQVVQDRFDEFWKDVRVQLTIEGPTRPRALPPLPSPDGPIQAGETLGLTIETPKQIFSTAVIVNSQGVVALKEWGWQIVDGLSLKEAEERIAKLVEGKIRQESEESQIEVTVRITRVQPAPVVYPGVDGPRPAPQY